MDFTPGTLTHSPLTPSPAHPHTPTPAPPTPASAPAWRTHLLTPSPHTTLPDGTPLRLTASGIDLFERLTGGSFIPQDFHESTVLLWCATRTPEELETLWIPAPPEDTEDAPGSPSLIPIYNIPGIMRHVVRWRDAIIPPGARLEAHRLALALWNHEHGTLLEIDEAGLPDIPDTEKKSPSAAPTGSSAPSTPSPPETPPAGHTSSTTSPTAPSSQPTAHGSVPTASPSSPPPPASAETPASTPSSPSPLPAEQWLARHEDGTFASAFSHGTTSSEPLALTFPSEHHAAQWIACTPHPAKWTPYQRLIPSLPSAPSLPSSPFWVAEIANRHPLLYATGQPNATGAGEQLTSDIHQALRFPTEIDALQWINQRSRPAAFIAREHQCL